LKQKKECYEKGKATNHYPMDSTIFDKGNVSTYKKVELNEIQKGLAGIPYIK